MVHLSQSHRRTLLIPIPARTFPSQSKASLESGIVVVKLPQVFVQLILALIRAILPENSMELPSNYRVYSVCRNSIREKDIIAESLWNPRTLQSSLMKVRVFLYLRWGTHSFGFTLSFRSIKSGPVGTFLSYRVMWISSSQV
jgi:hypothetical protein